MILLLLACHHAEEDLPRFNYPPLPLEPFRAVTEVKVSGSRLLRLDRAPWTWVLNRTGVAVVDSRYHYDPDSRCVDTSFWTWEIGDRQQNCASGEVQLRRGFLDVGAAPASFAVDQAVAYILDVDGNLWSVPADPMLGNPYDFMRVSTSVPLEAGAGLLAVGEGVAYVASGNTFWTQVLDGHSAATQSTLPGEALDFVRVDGHNYVLTSGGLWRDGTVLAVEGQRLGRAPAGVVVSNVVGGKVSFVGVDAPVLLSESTQMSGPVAVDPASGRWFVGVEGGVEVWDQGGVLGRYETVTPSDIWVTATHEILVQSTEGLAVFLDETVMAGAPPLGLSITAFVERPRKAEDNVPCLGEESVSAFVDRAVLQTEWLKAQPLPQLLGITPFAASRIRPCAQADNFEPVWDRPYVETGVLYHDVSEGCVGDCYTDSLREDAKELENLGMSPTWISGIGPQEDLGLDWVVGLQAADAPRVASFTAMSWLPEVDHTFDPRAKDPWPVLDADISTIRHVSHASSLATDTSGPVTVLAGDNVPVFSLGGCADQFLWECYLSGGSTGHDVDEEDIKVLDVLVHRAVAMRGEESSWSFHLPDIGVFDYTEGCTVVDGHWEDCDAGLLQDWSIAAYRRYVCNDLARPMLASDF